MLKARILFIIKNQFSHCYYSDYIKAFSLKYESCGDPLTVIKLTENSFLKKLKDNEILIKYLSSVIHPSDINTIQGQYPIRPPLPAVVGNEGYAEVIDVGNNCNLKVGDRVINREMNIGTCTSHKILKESQVIHIATKLDPELGAVFCVNPASAYRMLTDFATLKEGDVIIQNGGTSAVGIYVIQLAKLRKLISINIIRSRSSETATKSVKEVLQKTYGADYVLTEEELKTELSRTLERTGMAKLALNCVGGKAVLPLLKSLKEAGVLVTYGAMNRQPMQVPVSPLLFNDVSLKGFWMSRWSNMRRDSVERQEMLDKLADMFRTQSLKPSPFETFDFKSQWKEAISRAMFKDETPEGLNKKGILLMNDC